VYNYFSSRQTLWMEKSDMFSDRADKKEIESGLLFRPKFDEAGLIPAIVTDWQTGELLMVAYMNEESLRKTLELGEAVYYSRSRKELWHKGATSGMTQKVREIRVDCDQDALWLRVEQMGGAACHTGRRTCFYRAVDPTSGPDEPVRLKLVVSEQVFDPDKVYGKKS